MASLNPTVSGSLVMTKTGIMDQARLTNGIDMVLVSKLRGLKARDLDLEINLDQFGSIWINLDTLHLSPQTDPRWKKQWLCCKGGTSVGLKPGALGIGRLHPKLGLPALCNGISALIKKSLCSSFKGRAKPGMRSVLCFCKGGSNADSLGAVAV